MTKAGETALAEWASPLPLSGEEAELVAGLLENSEQAFAWLVARYQAPVYNLVYQLLQDPSDAPDTVQQVFLKVFRGLRGFKGDCSLKTWIYRIAVNEASNQRRWWRRHRQRELSLDLSPASAGEDAEEGSLSRTLVDDSQSPYEQAVSAELRAAVEVALQELPLPFRTAVMLRDVEELSYEEIAEVLKVRVGTVKSRLARGREVLRSKLLRYLGRTAPCREFADSGSKGTISWEPPARVSI